MANRNKLDRKGRPFRKLDVFSYYGRKYYDILRLWYPKLPKKGSHKWWYIAGHR